MFNTSSLPCKRLRRIENLKKKKEEIETLGYHVLIIAASLGRTEPNMQDMDISTKTDNLHLFHRRCKLESMKTLKFDL